MSVSTVVITVALTVLGVGLGVWLTVRSRMFGEDFRTSRGLRVKVLDGAVASREDVQAWEDWTVRFWEPHVDYDVADRLRGFKVVFDPRPEIVVLGRSVRAYNTGGRAVIGSTNPESLIKHELSHLLCPLPFDEAAAHQEFARLGLGH